MAARLRMRRSIEAIRAMQDSGQAVMFYPFVLMEQLDGERASRSVVRRIGPAGSAVAWSDHDIACSGTFRVARTEQPRRTPRLRRFSARLQVGDFASVVTA